MGVFQSPSKRSGKCQEDDFAKEVENTITFSLLVSGAVNVRTVYSFVSSSSYDFQSPSKRSGKCQK